MAFLLAQLRHWPLREQLMLPEAAWRLRQAERLVKTISFKELQQLLDGGVPKQPELQGEQAAEVAGRVGRVIRSAARHLPWECACLAQGVAARHMLLRRGIPTVLRIGVAKEAGEAKEMESHAWLTQDTFIVTGREGHERFKEIIRI